MMSNKKQNGLHLQSYHTTNKVFSLQENVKPVSAASCARQELWLNSASHKALHCRGCSSSNNESGISSISNDNSGSNSERCSCTYNTGCTI